MEQVKQKYPTFLVILVIIFLSIFIIVPPISRVLFPKEVVDDKEEVVEESDAIVLNCQKKYENTKLSIISTSNYLEDTIIDNTITFNNPSNITSTTVKEEEKKDFENYSSLLKVFDGIDEEYMIEDTLDTRIFIDETLLEKYSNNKNITNQFQEIEKQQKYYESLGFTCEIN